MHFLSKKSSLIILGVISLVFSRAMFVFFNDPEGPNLLIVVVMAAILFLLSASLFRFNTSISPLKRLFLAILIQIIIVTGIVIFDKKQQVSRASDYKAAEYIIEGTRVTLGDEVRYFGNDLVTDLNGGGRNDVVFLVTRASGGSGTFFYAVAALNTEAGYRGSDGYFLGDRIAPQSINLSPNPKHKNVIVVNYADRREGEPMTTPPSVGKSAYLKLNYESLQWGVVEPNFEGESNR